MAAAAPGSVRSGAIPTDGGHAALCHAAVDIVLQPTERYEVVLEGGKREELRTEFRKETVGQLKFSRQRGTVKEVNGSGMQWGASWGAGR